MCTHPCFTLQQATGSILTPRARAWLSSLISTLPRDQGEKIMSTLEENSYTSVDIIKQETVENIMKVRTITALKRGAKVALEKHLAMLKVLMFGVVNSLVHVVLSTLDMHACIDLPLALSLHYETVQHLTFVFRCLRSVCVCQVFDIIVAYSCVFVTMYACLHRCCNCMCLCLYTK
jgi:hypothetical protein